MRFDLIFDLNMLALSLLLCWQNLKRDVVGGTYGIYTTVFRGGL